MQKGVGSPRLDVQGVWKRLGSEWVLRDVSFTCEGPGLLIIEGPNGSGKSTLARLIVGIHAPDKGRISLGGLDPSKDPGKAQRLVASAFEGTWLPPYVTGVGLAEEFAEARGIDWDSILYYARELNVTRYWKKYIYTYSMGMRKRLLLSLAFASALGTEFLLLDEPYTLVDRDTRGKVSKIIRNFSKEKTVIIITHVETQTEKNYNMKITLDLGRVEKITGSC